MEIDFNCSKLVLDVAKWPTNSRKNTVACTTTFVASAFFKLPVVLSIAIGMSVYSVFHFYENQTDQEQSKLEKEVQKFKEIFNFKSPEQKKNVITKFYVETMLRLDNTSDKAKRQFEKLLQIRGWKIFKQFKIFPDEFRNIWNKHPNDVKKRKESFQIKYEEKQEAPILSEKEQEVPSPKKSFWEKFKEKCKKLRF